MDAGERKKKSSRLRRRMRRVLALLSRPMRRRAARHVTDGSRQMLVSNEQQQQQPEIEFELDTVTSAPEVVVSPAPSDRQAKMTILVKLRKSFRRRNLKTNRAKPDIEDTTSLPTSTSGLFEAEQDRLIELVDEPTEVETRVDDNIATTILSPGEPEVDQIVRHSSEDTTERQVEPEADDVTKQFDDVTRGYDGGKKKHRKRKRAKRYAKRAGVKAWKGLRRSWKYFSSGLVMWTSSPVLTVNTSAAIVEAWQLWHGTSGRHRPSYNPAARPPTIGRQSAV